MHNFNQFGFVSFLNNELYMFGVQISFCLAIMKTVKQHIQICAYFEMGDFSHGGFWLPWLTIPKNYETDGL